MKKHIKKNKTPKDQPQPDTSSTLLGSSWIQQTRADPRSQMFRADLQEILDLGSTKIDLADFGKLRKASFFTCQTCEFIAPRNPRSQQL
jgi:hypothetical protein